MKWLIWGVVHGSEVKTHEAKHEKGGMEEGLMEDLKAWRAAISEGGVVEVVVEMMKKMWRRKIKKVDMGVNGYRCMEKEELWFLKLL